MVRIVFASDSHLNKHYARMTPDQLAGRRERLRAAFGLTVDFALAEGAHLYVHGGDLFDSPNPRAVELTWVAGRLQRLTDAGISVLLVGGNHDIPKTLHHGAAPQALFETVRLARTFDSPGAVTWHELSVDGTRIAVGGLPPDPRLAAGDDPLAMLTEPIEPPAADFVVLVTHYALDGFAPPLAEEPTIARSSIAALAGRVDYLLVGHAHNRRQVSVDGVEVFLPGPTERMTFGEIDVRCGFAYLTVDGRRPCRVTARAIDLPTQPMRRETVRAADIPSGDPTGWLSAVVRGVSAADQILQLRLEGSLPRSIYQALDFLSVWRVGNEQNFYFDLDRYRLTVTAGHAMELPASGDARVSPRDEIARVADGMMASVTGDAARTLVAEARALALDHYGGAEGLEDSRDRQPRRVAADGR